MRLFIPAWQYCYNLNRLFESKNEEKKNYYNRQRSYRPYNQLFDKEE